MHRRILRFAAISVVFLSACASTAEREFASDRMSVITRGSGPDVILIPGLTGHREEWWGEVVETLDDRYRLHLVQVNGFAGTAPGANIEGPVSAPVAEEMARYIRERDLDRPAVIGHSMGGTVGMMLAARHPDVVGRLMVVDMMPSMGAFFGPAGETPEGLRGIADQARAQILETPPGTGFIAQLFEGMTLNTQMQPVLMRLARESDRRTVADAFHELVVTDMRPELARINAPITVLYAQPPNVQLPADQFDASMAGLYANAPNTTLVRIDDSRHFIQWDQPARFIAEIDAFMARQRGRRPLEAHMSGLEGGCACGEVRYRLTSSPMFVHCCHCLNCQRQTGTAFVLNMLIEASRVELLGGTPTAIAVPRENGLHRIFRCPTCQVAVWSEYGGRSAVLFVRAGTLDDPARISPDVHIYTRSKLPWIILPDSVPTFEEYYDAKSLWPPESLARRKALFG